MITQEDVRELFCLDGKNVIWNAGRKKGCVAGSISDYGYYRVKIKNKHYFTHRLIYLLHHGVLPDFLDHINGDKVDNSIENLRPATKLENNRNVGLRKTNKSGAKGVCWNKGVGKWMAQITANSNLYYLGLFDDIDVAAQVVRIERIRLHGEFANHG